MKLPSLSARRPSEEALFDALREGEPAAFDHLYREVLPSVRRVLAARSCPVAEADDLFQEALVALWQNARDGSFQLRKSTKISTYLIHLCTNRWIDRTRRVDFRSTDSGADLPASAHEDADEVGVMRERRFIQLETAFAQLGEKCRGLLMRFYFDREGLDEVGTWLGISTASAKTEKYRCMQRLRILCAKSQDFNPGIRA